MSINIFVKHGKNDKTTENNKATEKNSTTEDTEGHGVEEEQLAEVFHYDLYGLRDDKYNFLDNKRISSVKWERIEPSTPLFFFVPKNFSNLVQYEEGFSIQDLFMIGSVGIVTANDKLFINLNPYKK